MLKEQLWPISQSACSVSRNELGRMERQQIVKDIKCNVEVFRIFLEEMRSCHIYEKGCSSRELT